MKRTRTVRQPCVFVPATVFRDEEHVIHSTEWRAKRNAALTAHTLTSRYHVHESERLTVYGWIRKLITSDH